MDNRGEREEERGRKERRGRVYGTIVGAHVLLSGEVSKG